jgi:flavin reductase (DIM6/NTAB) family NADH-FMN oxidoreductase RutF
MTVNSFTSVSLDPPLVLWCLKKDSHRYKVFAEADSFTINVLGTEHENVSARLARQGEHRLTDIDLLKTELGPPALADAHAVFECARESVHDAGDHLILVGRVLRFARRDDGAPLVFYRGRYGALSG